MHVGLTHESMWCGPVRTQGGWGRHSVASSGAASTLIFVNLLRLRSLKTHRRTYAHSQTDPNRHAPHHAHRSKLFLDLSVCLSVHPSIYMDA